MMKIAVASDEQTHLTQEVIQTLQTLGHEVILFGRLKEEPLPWPIVSQQLAETVAQGIAEQGTLKCCLMC